MRRPVRCWGSAPCLLSTDRFIPSIGSGSFSDQDLGFGAAAVCSGYLTTTVALFLGSKQGGSPRMRGENALVEPSDSL
jgi:hypothetical protein